MLSSALSSLDEHQANVYGADRPARGSGGGRGGRRRGAGSSEDARSESISRKLSWLLRHGATKEGIQMDEGGWVKVDDLFKWNTLKSLKVTFPELKKVVDTNAKKRFELAPIISLPSASTSSPAPNAEANLDFETSDAPSLASLSLTDKPDPESPASWRIRATQGHSIDTVQSDSLLQALDPTAPSTPRFVVHGTTPQSWTAIKASSGLSKMGRGHVHFATGTGDADGDAETLKSLGGEDVVPGDEVLPTHGAKTEGPDGAKAVISGMRASSNILVWVDVRKSSEGGGLKWWRSGNGVVLTEGDARGMVPLEYVALVERRKKGKKERQVFWPKEGAA